MDNFSINLDGIWYAFETCYVMNLILIFFCPFNIQGREAHLDDFVK